jgi:hypothetical protein
MSSDDPKRLRVSLSNVRVSFLLDCQMNGATGLLLAAPEPGGMRFRLVEVDELDELQPAIREQIWQHLETAALELIDKYAQERSLEQAIAGAAKGQA